MEGTEVEKNEQSMNDRSLSVAVASMILGTGCIIVSTLVFFMLASLGENAHGIVIGLTSCVGLIGCGVVLLIAAYKIYADLKNKK